MTFHSVINTTLLTFIGKFSAINDFYVVNKQTC